MALTIAHVSSIVLNNIQILTEKLGLNVAVGPISDDDWLFITQGNSKLNWDYALTKYVNDPNCFSISLKLRDSKYGKLLGASISICDLKSSAVDIHCIEHFFYENKKTNPVKGKMLFLTISAAFMFSRVASINNIRLIDVDESIIPLYEKYGFVVVQKVPEICMSAVVDDIQDKLKEFVKQ